MLSAEWDINIVYFIESVKRGVRGCTHELFVWKPERARYERVGAFDTSQQVNITPYKAISMTWAVYYT